MALVLFAGVALAVTVEVPRLYRRWEYCRYQAEQHGLLESYARQKLDLYRADVRRMKAITWYWRHLPARDYTIADLIAESGQPEFLTRFFTLTNIQLMDLSVFHPRYIYLDEERLTEVDYPNSAAQLSNLLVPPEIAARFLETHWGRRWSEASAETKPHEEMHARIRNEYLRAASRPWRPIPNHVPLP